MRNAEGSILVWKAKLFRGQWPLAAGPAAGSAAGLAAGVATSEGLLRGLDLPSDLCSVTWRERNRRKELQNGREISVDGGESRGWG